MNRMERNTIREATAELARITAELEAVKAERDALARSNRWLRGRLNGFLRKEVQS